MPFYPSFRGRLPLLKQTAEKSWYHDCNLSSLEVVEANQPFKKTSRALHEACPSESRIGEMLRDMDPNGGWFTLRGMVAEPSSRTTQETLE